MKPTQEEAGYPSRAESMREDASAYRAILQTLKTN